MDVMVNCNIFVLYDTVVIHLLRGTRPVVTRNPIATPLTPKAEFYIKQIGMFLYVFTEHGITLEWDKGMRVYITIAPEYMNKVCGLCGNYDNRADNDFRARTGQVGLHNWVRSITKRA